MRFAITIVGRILPPAFVLFLFLDTLVNPNIPRLGTVTAGAGIDGQLTPEESRALLAKSKKLLRAGKDTEALVPALKLSSVYPENYIYNRTLAEIYHRLGKFKEEADYWERFLKNAPLPDEACPQVAQSYWAQKLYDKGTDAFERCLAFDPDVADSIFFLAHARELMGDDERALKLYRQALVHHPRNTDSRIGLARVESRNGMVASAKKRILEVLHDSPNNVDALLVAGLVYWREGDLALAKQYLVKGTHFTDGYADYYHVLGRIEESQGHTREALMRYDRALQLDPENKDVARRRLALGGRRP